MFEGFNDAARLVVVDAQVHAYELGHDYVGVEHLVLGLLAGRSVASEVCTGMGLELTAASTVVSERVAGRPHAGRGGLLFDERAVEVLVGARKEAARRRHRLVTALHVGVALCSQLAEADTDAWQALGPVEVFGPGDQRPASAAAAVLTAAQVSADELRRAMVDALDAAVEVGTLEVAGRRAG